MDHEDRRSPRRRRLAIAGAAVIATLSIAVPAAFAATGGGSDGSTTGTTPSQTQPGPQDAPDRGADRGPWGDHRGPCPEKDGNGDRRGSEPGSSGSSSDASPATPQSSDVASF